MRWWHGTILLIVALLSASVAGCALWKPKPTFVQSEVPHRNQIKLDQMVVHCNFDLPPSHRLLQEINDLRIDVSQRLALPVSREPIHVYLFQDADGFTSFLQAKFPGFPPRRAFFVEDDTTLSVYAHWGDRVAEDLRHEMSHGYMHSVVRKLPLWLDEGLAEFFEVPRGQNGLNKPHVDELINAAAQGRWHADLRLLESLENAATMNQMQYAESWAWAYFMLQSTPQRTAVLQDYLTKLRREGTIEPLSIYLRRLDPNPDQSLEQYVHLLQQENADSTKKDAAK